MAVPAFRGAPCRKIAPKWVPGEGRDPFLNHSDAGGNGSRPEFIFGPAGGRTRGPGPRINKSHRILGRGRAAAAISRVVAARLPRSPDRRAGGLRREELVARGGAG